MSKNAKISSADEIIEKPKAAPGDIGHTLARAGLSAIPIVGGPAAELFSAIIVPPLARRRDEWIQSIAEGLEQPKGEFDNFNIDELAQNESFVTTVLQATQVALRNHQEEKLEALRNAVLHSALPTAPEDDLQLTFLNLVDTLTTWHIRILNFFDDLRGWGEKHGLQYPNWYSGGPATVLEHVFPELQSQRDFYDLVASDLFSRGLLSIGNLHATMTEKGMFTRRTTRFGRQFLRFIASPLEFDGDEMREKDS